ncbi:hypothetical protein PRK78_006697 [Emydomyces testavorans]|uniref:Uncharacterized protein n=1 Tax=Emydomyces testavorans TaxID=2070801 RepID=A0AAF0DNX6_9EURO|nr:hypothetical protein PRK78_006697 [Emydomyces testavorans]
MAQHQIQTVSERSHNFNLDMAAKGVSDILTSANKKHGFIGGYAASLLGGTRMTNDVDVIVGDDAKEIRELLLRADQRFFMSQGNKLKYKVEAVSEASPDVEIIVELLQGGANMPLKLPDARNVPLIQVNPSEVGEDRLNCEVPLIHPAVLVLTKIKRWMYIAESTRPASIKKAINDEHDIEALLKWLQERNVKIEFSWYPEKPKGELLPGLQLLLQRGPSFHDLLKRTLHPEDFQAIL